jgi:nucleotide-binding universal stress UspA family protein
MNSLSRKILLCYDNSAHAKLAAEASVFLSKNFDFSVVCMHGYNAAMHDGAFRIMEPVIPAPYQGEERVAIQRQVHRDLIRSGLESISRSYLKDIQSLFEREGIHCRVVVREGKNFEAVNRVISEEEPDLVLLGSCGFNHGEDGYLGSVCTRVVRQNNRNFLIVKGPVKFNRFVVCLDGSASSIEALKAAKSLWERSGSEMHIIYVYDARLHRALFSKLKETVSSLDGLRFDSEQQERIHDEFIDKGLEHVGSLIIQRAMEECHIPLSDELEGWGPATWKKVRKEIIEGHIYRAICDYARDVKADVVFMGRTGRHFVRGMDLGSVAENVLRFSPCSLFLTRHKEFTGWEI